MDQPCLGFWTSRREEPEPIQHAAAGLGDGGRVAGRARECRSPRLGPSYSQKSRDGEGWAPGARASLPCARGRGVPAGSPLFACASPSPAVRLIALPLRAFARRGREPLARGGMRLSSFSHRGRVGGGLLKQKGRYPCHGEGEGCSARCVRWARAGGTWPRAAGHGLLHKPAWGAWLPPYLCLWLIKCHRKRALRMCPSKGSPSDGACCFAPRWARFRALGERREGDGSAQHERWSHGLWG